MQGLLDTSIAIELLRGGLVQSALPSEIRVWCLTTTVVGELLYGALRSARPIEGLAVLERFLPLFQTIELKTQTARAYADIRMTLAKGGELIPDNDIWIAASAVEHNVLLVSMDTHFERVSGLKHHLIRRDSTHP